VVATLLTIERTSLESREEIFAGEKIGHDLGSAHRSRKTTSGRVQHHLEMGILASPTRMITH
jgi:hypothetical protein